MTYQPQKFITPEGTEMVILSATEFERLRGLAEEADDVAEAETALKRIEAGEGTMPGEVLDMILDENLTAIAAWRRHRGLSQAELARRAGLSQVFVSKIERGASHGTPKTRRSLADALDAPLWSLEDSSGPTGSP